MFYQLAEAGLEPPQDSTRKTANSKEGGAKSGAAGAGQRRTPFWPNLSPYGQTCRKQPERQSWRRFVPCASRFQVEDDLAPEPIRRQSHRCLLLTLLNSGGDRVILLVATFFRAAPYPHWRNYEPAPALPTSRRDTRGQACVKSLMGIKRRTGVSMPKHLLLKMAFDSGYEAGAKDAGSGELLVETLDLRYALYDLDGKTRRAIALDNWRCQLRYRSQPSRRDGHHRRQLHLLPGESLMISLEFSTYCNDCGVPSRARRQSSCSRKST